MYAAPRAAVRRRVVAQRLLLQLRLEAPAYNLHVIM